MRVESEGLRVETGGLRVETEDFGFRFKDGKGVKYL